LVMAGNVMGKNRFGGKRRGTTSREVRKKAQLFAILSREKDLGGRKMKHTCHDEEKKTNGCKPAP